MPGYNASEVRDCYNRTAAEYAETYLHELDGKPFDRNILDRFDSIPGKGSLIYDFGRANASKCRS